VYSFTLGTVNASSSNSVMLIANVNPTLPPGLPAITAVAGIHTTTPGDDPADNFAQDADSITTVPSLALSVGFDSTTPYETKIVTYTIRYTNTSAMDTTGVVITVTRSPFVTDLSSGWSANGTDQSFSVGYLSAFGTGMVTYVVSLPITFTFAMTSFVNLFAVHDDGPGGLPVASAMSATAIGVPDLVIESVSLSPGKVIAGQKFTATVTIRNQGTGRACNPNSSACINGSTTQGGTLLDAFINPPSPPSSYGYVNGYVVVVGGPPYYVAYPLGPGLTETIVITGLSFAVNQVPILYLKIDNYGCLDRFGNVIPACSPSNGLRGLVPESNEYNNVFGP
jgi:hypothetical protein